MLSAGKKKKGKPSQGRRSPLPPCTIYPLPFSQYLGTPIVALSTLTIENSLPDAAVAPAAGTYFPGVSLYMGGSVRVNFGPEFVYPPPRSHGWKPVAALKPFSKDEMKVRLNALGPVWRQWLLLHLPCVRASLAVGVLHGRSV